MDNVLRTAIIWGVVCFLLLYRTLPSDTILWWRLYQHYDVPALQLIANFSTEVLPALMPMGCFLLMRRRATSKKMPMLLIPFAAWLSSKFITLGIFYFISVKIGNIPPYSGGYFNMVKGMLTVDWFINTLTFVLTIMACSYAFWREYERNVLIFQSVRSD